MVAVQEQLNLVDDEERAKTIRFVRRCNDNLMRALERFRAAPHAQHLADVEGAARLVSHLLTATEDMLRGATNPTQRRLT